MVLQLNWIVAFCLAFPLLSFADTETESAALKSTLDGVRQKVELGRKSEVGLIVYGDVAVFISNDYPGSGNRQVYFYEKKNIDTLKQEFESRGLPIKKLRESFDTASPTLKCVTRSKEPTLEKSSDSHPCKGDEKADKQFAQVVEAWKREANAQGAAQ